MIVTQYDTVMNVELAAESTICQVESDAIELGRILNESNGVTAVRIETSQCETIDTAYLQLLLSLIVSLQRKSIAIEIQDMTNSFETLYKLYGITLGQTTLI